jgi:hypothetical protein
MNIARTILAVLIATSVALLPVAGSGASAAPSSNMSVSMDMSAPDDMSVAMDMSDCCPQQAAPCDKANAGCASMLACAGIVLSLSAPSFLNFVFPVVLAELMPALTSQTLRSQTNTPPFRPPRV